MAFSWIVYVFWREMRVFKGMFRWIVNLISNPFQSAASYCSVAPIPLNAFPAIISLLRARIYANYFLKKSFIRSQQVSNRLVFIGFRCEGLSLWTFHTSPLREGLGMQEILSADELLRDFEWGEFYYDEGWQKGDRDVILY